MVLRYSCDHLLSICQSGRHHISAVCFEVHTSKNFFVHYYSQVGKWDCKDRIRFFEEEYFFHCQCCGCSQMNISDLVINGYCCVNTSCTGVVLDSSVAACESEKLNHFLAAPKSLDHHFLVI